MTSRKNRRVKPSRPWIHIYDIDGNQLIAKVKWMSDAAQLIGYHTGQVFVTLGKPSLEALLWTYADIKSIDPADHHEGEYQSVLAILRDRVLKAKK